MWQRIQTHTSNTAATDKTQETRRPLPHKLLGLTSLCYVFAMVCSNEAIQFVSYPVAVLAKSCKLIPTMLIGQLVEKRLYSQREWVAALCISTGIVIFHWSRMNQSLSSGTTVDGENYGMTLLLVSLSLDGVLSSCQNLLKRCDVRLFRVPNAVETMFWVNVYANLALVPLLAANGQWEAGMKFLAEPGQAFNVLVLNMTVAIGQVFIFLTLTW